MKRSALRPIVIALALCVVLAAVEAAQARLASAFRGESMHRPIGASFLIELPFWISIALLTPFILWLARRFPLMEREGRGRAILVHGAASIVFPFVHIALTVAGMLFVARSAPHPPVGDAIAGLLGTYYVLQLLLYFLIAGGYSAFAYREKYRERRMAAASLTASLAQARLQALRAQLNPHFMFNTLNAIIELAAQKQHALVGDVASRLAHLLRASLDDTHATTSLAREIEFTAEYLAIEAVRFGDHLRVERHIAESCATCQVPSLLLQPLVENAVRHAVARSADPVTITISTQCEQERLTIVVSDDGPGIVGGLDAVREGVGLGNTRARLHQIYQDDAAITTTARRGGGFEVQVVLPVRS